MREDPGGGAVEGGGGVDFYDGPAGREAARPLPAGARVGLSPPRARGPAGARRPAERLRPARRGGGAGGGLFQEVWEACSKLGLPRVVCETALGLARALRPRSRAALAAALYKAASAHARPLYPREVAEAFEVEFGEVRPWLFKLAGAGGVRAGGRLDLSKAFLARILADVGASVKPGVAAVASEIACKALKPGNTVKPLQLAAVAAYVACKLYNHQVSPEQVAGLTGVGEASLSKTARRMEVTVRVWL